MKKDIYLNPHDDKIIGVVGEYIYLRAKHQDYVIAVKEKEYFETLKEYIKSKKDYCERLGYFCGVFGEFRAKKSRKMSRDYILDEVHYPIYSVQEFHMDCDMEMG